MKTPGVWALATVTALSLALGECPRDIEQVLVLTPGFQEPHTPGSGEREEFGLSDVDGRIRGYVVTATRS